MLCINMPDDINDPMISRDVVFAVEFNRRRKQLCLLLIIHVYSTFALLFQNHLLK